MKRPLTSITMENRAEILIKLYPEEAPNTVNSFIFLANGGFFDNHAIERIIPCAFADMNTTYCRMQSASCAREV